MGVVVVVGRGMGRDRLLPNQREGERERSRNRDALKGEESL